MFVNGKQVPDYYPCDRCNYTWTDPIKTSTTTDYNGKTKIEVTYKCRNCGHEFTKKVYWEE